jgi:small-conductance mechanosensitive channel
MVREMSGLVVFLAAGLVVFFALFGDHAPARQAAMAGLGTVVAVRLFALLSRFVIAPGDSDRRMVPMTDDDARVVHNRILALLAYMGAVLLLQGLARRFGVSPQIGMSLGLSSGLGLLALWSILIWQMRGPVARAILGGEGAETSRLARVVARTWHFYVIGAFAAIFLVAVRARALGDGEAVAPQAIGTLFLVVLLPLVISASRLLLAESFERRRAAEDDETDGMFRQSLETAFIRILSVVWILAAIFVIASMWGVDIFALESTSIGAVVFDAIFDIGAILIISYFLWVFGKAAIDFHLRKDEPAEEVEAGEIGGAGATRMATLLPLIRTTFMIFLLIMVVFVILSELGVNVGPLIAGAGVLGIAIGFGAQTLVTDIFSGIFFLIDDAFRRGEYIDVGSAKGTVEKISVRSLQLRHHRGPLHTVPFGNIGALSNYSRDWVVVKMELRLPFETDINKVRKIIKKIGIELLEDEILGPDMLAPLKSQGVNRMDDSALIIRCKFTAIPGKQFVIRREAFSRIQKALAEQGIKFAPRRVLVESSSPDTAQAAAAGVADGGEAEGSA